MIKRYFIDTQEMGIDYQDAGPWRSYELTASGDNYQEMIDDAFISEVDQDGGEIRTYDIAEASEEVKRRAAQMILNFGEDQDNRRKQADRDYRTNRAIDELKESRQ